MSISGCSAVDVHVELGGRHLTEPQYDMPLIGGVLLPSGEEPPMKAGTTVDDRIAQEQRDIVDHRVPFRQKSSGVRGVCLDVRSEPVVQILNALVGGVQLHAVGMQESTQHLYASRSLIHQLVEG